jgi:hypothetical protein
MIPVNPAESLGISTKIEFHVDIYRKNLSLPVEQFYF